MPNWNAINNALSNEVLERDRLEDLLVELGCERVKVYRGGSSFRLPCPIHEGKKDNLNIKTDGSVLPIRWACHSNHCEMTWMPSLLGFVRGVLSTGRLKPVHPQVAVDYLTRFLGGMPSARPRRVQSRARPQFTLLKLTREQVRARLAVPSPYFVERGFVPAILECFDVGYSAKKRKSIVPLHSDDGETVIGYMERSQLPSCNACKKCHGPNQPCRDGEVRWSMMPGFPKGEHLYNYHTALRSPTRTVLLVEGPGDVWRAAEAGYLAVALLGLDVSRRQIEKLAALKKAVLVALDNDKAGRKAMSRVQQCLERKVLWAQSLFIHSPYKDLGSMPIDEAIRWLSSVILTP